LSVWIEAELPDTQKLNNSISNNHTKAKSPAETGLFGRLLLNENPDGILE
jgi:hypothetical protein